MDYIGGLLLGIFTLLWVILICIIFLPLKKYFKYENKQESTKYE